MARKLRNTQGIQRKHIEFAKSADNFLVSPRDLKNMSTWLDLELLGNREIKKRKIEVIVKRKLFRDVFNVRWDTRPTMLPAKHGPLLLPWNWEKRSRRSKAKVIAHELTHHNQDANIPHYEALYANEAWRWGLEMQCFAQEFWAMLVSSKWTDGYTEAQCNGWIHKLATRMPRNYAMQGEPNQIYEATREVMEHHRSEYANLV